MTVAIRKPVRPQPRHRSCRRLVFVSVVFAVLSASIALCPGVAAAAQQKQVSKEEAVAIAKRITGYLKAEVVRTERRRVDGSVFPFGRPKQRLVWEITLKGISLTNRSGATNHLIKGLMVLLDVETGSLIRIDSVPPTTGHLRYFDGRNLEKLLGGELRFVGLSHSPRVTFAEALTADPWPSVIPKAKRISAYLVTLSSPPHSGLPDKAPYWVVLAGGFQAHVFTDAPSKPATEVMYVIWAWEMPRGFAWDYLVSFVR